MGTKTNAPRKPAQPWFERRTMPGLDTPHWEIDNRWYLSAALNEAIAGGLPVLTTSMVGALQDGVDEMMFFEQLEATGLRLAATSLGVRSCEAVFANDRALVVVSLGGRHHDPDEAVIYSVDVGTTDHRLFAKIAAMLKTCLIARVHETTGSISALVKDRDGYHVNHVGKVGLALERWNYAPEVLEAYDHVVEDFGTNAPCGRLAVLHGIPGSGKSYLIRGLVQALANEATCVLVPPHLVENLADPALLPALLEERSDASGPIVLICEDGDRCLVKRDEKNMAAVQTVLNMADGLLGSMLDIRLLVTTNAKELDMDEAVTRDMRLCRQIHVGALSSSQATSVMQRLVPGSTVPCNSEAFAAPATLARVYKLARKQGWRPPPSDQRVARAVSAATAFLKYHEKVVLARQTGGAKAALAGVRSKARGGRRANGVNGRSNATA